jgi:hypothetical protein
MVKVVCARARGEEKAISSDRLMARSSTDASFGRVLRSSELRQVKEV